jgi:hypothetical protein
LRRRCSVKNKWIFFTFLNTTGGRFTDNNSRLFWNNSTHRFGLSSTTPFGLLSVNVSAEAGPSIVVGSSTQTFFIVDALGNVGISTTSPGTPLAVTGDAVVAGQVTGRIFTATSTLSASTFPYASTTALTVSGSLSIDALNGPLQANAGLVSATSSIGVLYGGTGLTTAPTYGQLLLGNASSGYTLSATSTLGIALSDTTGTLPANRGGTGFTVAPAYGSLLTGDGSGYMLLATSSLGLSITDIAGTVTVGRGGLGHHGH